MLYTIDRVYKINKMTEIILTPTTVDEIEFYVSNDGLTTGISISGLAKLVNKPRKTVSEILNTLQEGGEREGYKSLQSLSGKVFTPAAKGINGAKIINSQACAIFITNEALEKNNKTAKHSLTKFVEIGIDKWIKKVTGFSEENKLSELTELMYLMMGKFDKLEAATTKYNNIKSTTVSLYPGIDYINSEIEDGYLLEPSTNDNPFTATEWLSSKGLMLDKSTKHKFALLLGQTYSAITQKEPRKVMRRDKKGNLTQKLNGFVESEVPILEIVLKKLFNQL